MTNGLIDLQVNGYAGIDFNDAALTSAALDHALAAMRDDRVAACLPTLITAPVEALAARLAALDRAVAESRLGRAMVPGYHLEGPFLSPEPGYAGCHPPAAMLPPDPALVAWLEAPLIRPILLLTLAPERSGAAELIRWGAARGKLMAIGHSAASPDEIIAAAVAGARLSTHLGNALLHTQPKFANPMMAQLAEDRLSASFIADGRHIPPFALKVLLRAKGIARSLLVSDATAAAAAPPGAYRFAGMDIVRAEDGTVRLAGTDTLAGSALRLSEAVQNIIGWGLVSAAEAERMAADNPLALLAPAVAAHGGHWAMAGVG